MFTLNRYLDREGQNFKTEQLFILTMVSCVQGSNTYNILFRIYSSIVTSHTFVLAYSY